MKKLKFTDKVDENEMKYWWTRTRDEHQIRTKLNFDIIILEFKENGYDVDSYFCEIYYGCMTRELNININMNTTSYSPTTVKIWLDYFIKNNFITITEDDIPDDGLTEDERKIMNSLVYAWDEFVKLDCNKREDTDQFGRAIRSCQQQLCMRILRRQFPDAYDNTKK